LGGNEVQVLAPAAHRIVVECAARQDQRFRAGVGGEGEQGVKVALPCFPPVAVEHGVQVPDVSVHRAHPEAGRPDGFRDGGNGGCVQLVRDVVTDAGQGAQIDLLESQPLHGAQGSTQILVAEADG
jgi:hypothetical protein